ncbi:MAG: DUF523 domain-containing protein [Pseudomonadales bacterium]|nr:DUF523 domain-containing protein [Pseudomonadales bacterium]
MQSEISKPKVGISSCLMGQAVRYDGAAKYSRLCMEELRECFEFVSTCPELGAGLGVPRPPLRLVGEPAAPRMVQVAAPGTDMSHALRAYAAQRMPQLAELCGYIFMPNSPSCGLSGVALYRADGSLHEGGTRGLFAAALLAAYPDLPVEEEPRLYDRGLRAQFIARVMALHRQRAAALHALD